MRLNVRKDRLFVFAMAMIIGIAAFAQTENINCSLKIFVNDPYAQIVVDNHVVGAPPQIIPCSDREKNIMVRSSDGQTFSRLMTAKNNFDLANATLNVVFHKKMSDFAFQAVEPPVAEAPKAIAVEGNSTAALELQKSLQARQVDSTPTAATVKRLVGNFVQIFALKNLDMSKIEQDINSHYSGRVTQREIIVCPWQSTNGAQVLSLVLVGPFNKKSAALEAKNSIGGKSFLVTNPICQGDFTKVSR